MEPTRLTFTTLPRLSRCRNDLSSRSTLWFRPPNHRARFTMRTPKTANKRASKRKTHARTGNVPRLFRRHLAQSVQHGAVALVVAVGKVEAGDVHAGVHEGADVFARPTGGPHGAHDLGPAVRGVRLRLDAVQRDLSAVQRGNDARIGNHGLCVCVYRECGVCFVLVGVERF